MKKLTKAQWEKMDAWVQANARAFDRAKWDYLFHGGEKAQIVRELLKYQNEDGGFGNGLESDLFLPASAAIPSAEAIFQAYEFDLDCTEAWFQNLLAYFERTVQPIPGYWAPCPKEVLDYPHAPWWNGEAKAVFTPNPCGAAASALIRFGTKEQQALGYRIFGDCLALLFGDKPCDSHEALNLMALVEQLCAMDSPLATEKVLGAMRRCILKNVCFDDQRWHNYVFAPLDFVSSPDSMWFDLVKEGIERNLDYWLEKIEPEGVWKPNFSWGDGSEAEKQAMKNWKGYMAVKRAKILLAFDRIEK